MGLYFVSVKLAFDDPPNNVMSSLLDITTLPGLVPFYCPHSGKDVLGF